MEAYLLILLDGLTVQLEYFGHSVIAHLKSTKLLLHIVSNTSYFSVITDWGSIKATKLNDLFLVHIDQATRLFIIIFLLKWISTRGG